MVETAAAIAVDDITTLMPSFLRGLRAEGKSANTLRAYELSARQFVSFLTERGMPTSASAIAREHVEEFLLDVASRSAPNTTATRYRGLRRLFRWLVEEGEIPKSPMERMHEPAVPERPPAVPSSDEVTRLLKACAGTGHDERRDEAMVRLLAETGIRRAEIAGIRLVDLRLDDGTALVRGKGDRVRVVPFGAKTARAIDRYIRVRSRHPDARSDHLWLGKHGALTGNGVYQALRRRADDAGIEGFHPHLLRHRFAHRWLAAGGQEGDLMRLAGWRTREMVNRYGAAAAQDRAIEAARRLNLGDDL